MSVVYPPFFGVVRAAYPNLWFLKSNPFYNHRFRTKNDPPMFFFDFDPHTPPPPAHLGILFLGGSKLLCVLWPLCVYLDLGPERLFSCTWTP